jgi:hypothetical protein
MNGSRGLLDDDGPGTVTVLIGHKRVSRLERHYTQLSSPARTFAQKVDFGTRYRRFGIKVFFLRKDKIFLRIEVLGCQVAKESR